MRGVIASLLLLAVAPCHAQNTVDGFVARTFTSPGGTSLPYRLFIPDAKAREQPLPAILYLHGSGGAGTDNVEQISGGNRNGTHAWTTRKVQAQFPSFVVAPQVPPGIEWHTNGKDVSPPGALVLELLTKLSQEFAIDADRVYLVGQSMGGYGTWDLITKRPELFAGAVPLCGGGNPQQVGAARPVPVWAFHGARDEVVPVERSREMVRALRAAGGKATYTEYSDIGHDVWTRAFSEPKLPEWLFAQRRAFTR
jgi:predicted peptidase